MIVTAFISRYFWLIQFVLLFIANEIKALILSNNPMHLDARKYKSGGQLLWTLLLAHRLVDIH
jgi:hypothetical protein